MVQFQRILLATPGIRWYNHGESGFRVIPEAVCNKVTEEVLRIHDWEA